MRYVTPMVATALLTMSAGCLPTDIGSYRLGGGSTSYGTASLTFSDATDTNAILAPYRPAIVERLTAVGEGPSAFYGFRTFQGPNMADADDPNARHLGIQFTGSKPIIGQAYPMSPKGKGAMVTYDEGTLSTPEVWWAKSGTLTFTGNEAGIVTVVLKDIVMEPPGQSASRGSFTLNGSASTSSDAF